MTRKKKVLAATLNLQLLCQLALAIAVSASVLILSGCSKRYYDFPAFLPWSMSESANAGAGRFKTTFLAEQIDSFYRGVNPGPLGVTTFVNLDDLYSTSSFGRMYAEQLMSELSMRGFEVVELRHSDALQFLNSTGEMALSRDVSAIRRERELGGVVVGTYLASPKRVYVNARLLDPTTSMVLSAGSVEMGRTDEITRLLRGGGVASTLERIPVKHLGYTTYPLGSDGRVRAFDLEEEGSGVAPRLPAAGRGATLGGQAKLPSVITK